MRKSVTVLSSSLRQLHLRDAGPSDYAPIVLLPGDPARAQRIAARFDGGLDRARLVNSNRGLLGTWGCATPAPRLPLPTTCTRTRGSCFSEADNTQCYNWVCFG
jgi:hypothetical protein